MIDSSYRLLQKIKHGPLKRYKPFINWLAVCLSYDDEYDRIRKDFYDAILVDGYQYKWDRAQMSEGIYRKDSLLVKLARPGDIVLDIGANMGAEALPLSRIVEHVYAVEPIILEQLLFAVQANNVKNVTVLPMGLGGKDEVGQAHWLEQTVNIQLHTFDWFKKLCGRIDYLCCDCEGPEWFIEPEQCDGIRAFWMEFHIRHSHKQADEDKMTKWIIYWNKRNYQMECEKNKWDSPEFASQYHVYAYPKEG